MDYREEVIQEARKAIDEHPEHRSRIIDAVDWTLMEMDDGESEANEYELFMGRLDEIREGSQ
ncbi:hypothetical protein PDESU_00404 [Pontiella desulfatans]|uniref:Uncharacterized protein n=1 Tax=Pontiella desulfatans TaxID=2750659 RepID=A0A6C2TWB3_PONDE|nr:hypothetical protein [Pontiella desulfatans]VGO11857.1 hypothetical protein PDESU_00404 [Pontiella desulfatans]